jgi:hypothetical protein
MASETIKALLMTSLFCGLRVAFHVPQFNAQTIRRWRRGMIWHWPHWSMHAPVSHAMVSVRTNGRR